jgi:signal transduction histidine kinase
MVDVLPSVGTDQDLVGLPLGRGDEIGRLAKVLGDTHQSLREERDLRRKAERHAILGKMAASLAHEVRNPIAAIRLHAQLLDADALSDFELSRGLIVSEAERLEDLVGQWMSYARPEPPRLVMVDLAAILSESVRLITPQAMHAGVTIDLQCSDSGCPVEIMADRNRLMQVFGNLLRNAVQAMPSGGQVTVLLEDEPDRVVVMVSDQGAGFSENALEHLGEPFFSEKEGGMGLGLAVVKDICEAHRGNLEAHNLAGGGACIRVAFLKSPIMNSKES